MGYTWIISYHGTFATNNVTRMQKLWTMLHIQYFTFHFIFIEVNQSQNIGKTLLSQ